MEGSRGQVLESRPVDAKEASKHIRKFIFRAGGAALLADMGQANEDEMPSPIGGTSVSALMQAFLWYWWVKSNDDFFFII